jgi:hypothetical protein
MACVFKGWHCDEDQPAENIINLDMKLERSDVTVWSAYVLSRTGFDRS